MDGNMKTVLIVRPAPLSREIRTAISGDGFEVIETSFAEGALDALAVDAEKFAAAIFELERMTEDARHFIEVCKGSSYTKEIPILIIADRNDVGFQTECYRLGVFDFIEKDLPSDIIRLRIHNAIDHSVLALTRKLRHVRDYDQVTNIYGKHHFFEVTAKMLQENQGVDFAMVYFNIEKFRMLNSFFGIEEGDRFIRFIADILREIGSRNRLFTYGHMHADIFAFCASFMKHVEITAIVEYIEKELSHYPLAFNIVPKFGITIVENYEEDINVLYDEASLACRSCADNYLKSFAFYQKSLGEQALKDQYIANHMAEALADGQFRVYLQPQYDIRTNAMIGAEALVRWKDPVRGMISPGEFIPAFEHNGFITNLDYYVWDTVCALLRRWLDEGRKVCPISVNISQVDFLNVRLADTFIELTERHKIPRELLELELTESAYTSNPVVIMDTLSFLQKSGFKVLMDDFGSGYSSLNVLKDLPADILKIDMRFLSDSKIPGRGENILASVTRLAKWLEMPVIAEGVERKDQADFLRGIGCEFVQGYYFSKPMPIAEFEKLGSQVAEREESAARATINADSLWSATSQIESLFSNILQAVALFEYDGETVRLLRVNDAYNKMFGYRDVNGIQDEALSDVSPEDLPEILEAFHQTARSRGTCRCEFRRLLNTGSVIWLQARLKYVNTIGGNDVIFVSMSDVTQQKELDFELQRYRVALSGSGQRHDTILIIDDQEINRAILNEIFHESFTILEAENGRVGMEILAKDEGKVDLILLDLVMPEMDGATFLKRVRGNPAYAGIPVIIITAESSAWQQNNALEMGARDYIVKPFIPAVVRQRVKNVLESTTRVAEQLRDYEPEEGGNNT